MTPDAPPRSLVQRLASAPVTVLLGASCIAVFVVAETNGSTLTNATLLRFGAVWRDLVWQGEGWRLFTAMFLHIGLLHLVWNLVVGFSWLAPLERRLGAWRFLLVYLLSGLAGSAASVIGHDAVSAGSSGAIFGAIGGAIVLQYREHGSWRALWDSPPKRRDLIMVVLWLALGPLLNFDSFAHAGGLFAGMALTWALLPLRPRPLALALAGVALVSSLSLIPLPGLHQKWIDRRRVLEAFDRQDWPGVVAGTEHLAPSPDPQLAWARAEALTMLDRAGEAEPLLPFVAGSAVEVAGLKARVHSGQGKYALALEDLAAGLRVSPVAIPLLETRASTLLNLGRNAEATEVTQQLVKLAPDQLETKVALARTYGATHQLQRALDTWAEVQRRAPGRFDAERVQLMVTAGNYDEARALVREGKLSADTRVQLACFVEASAGELETARARCAEGTSPWFREMQAAIAAAADECDSALTLLEKAPRSAFVQVIVASCLIKRGPRADAVELVNGLRLAYPNDLQVLLLRLALANDEHAISEVLAAFEGTEAEATHSLVWLLLPAQTRALLPRR